MASLETKSKRAEAEAAVREKLSMKHFLDNLYAVFGCDESESDAFARSGGFAAKLAGTTLSPAAVRGRGRRGGRRGAAAEVRPSPALGGASTPAYPHPMVV